MSIGVSGPLYCDIKFVLTKGIMSERVLYLYIQPKRLAL